MNQNGDFKTMFEQIAVIQSKIEFNFEHSIEHFYMCDFVKFFRECEEMLEPSERDLL